jgi:hypothetical protein
VLPSGQARPYPSVEEADAAVKEGLAISVTDLQRDKVLLGKTEYALAPGLGKRIVDEAQQWILVGSPPAAGQWMILGSPPGTQSVSTKAILWQEECLVIEFSPTVLPTAGALGVIVLISRESGKPFAWYVMKDY